MLNNVVLVGRVVQEPTLQNIENSDKKVTNITLAIPRSYKNADGVYDTDFVDCVLWNGIAENASEYVKKGDVIGVKGRLETNLYEDKNGEKRKSVQLIADRITCLSRKSKDKEPTSVDKEM